MANPTKTFRDRINNLASGETNWQNDQDVFSELRRAYPDQLPLIEQIETTAGEMSNLVCEIEEASDDDHEAGEDDEDGLESLSSMETLDQEHEEMGEELEVLMDALKLP